MYVLFWDAVYQINAVLSFYIGNIIAAVLVISSYISSDIWNKMILSV